MRYRAASPVEMLPLGIKQALIIGAQDTIVRPQHNRTYADAANKSGDDVELIVLDNAAHFDVIAPSSVGWPVIQAAVFSMLNGVEVEPGENLHDSTSTSIADKRRVFRQLHESGCFVIPNPWDVGSALFLQGLGFKALATTSSGFAWSRGAP